jgi:hypothetical protein
MWQNITTFIELVQLPFSFVSKFMLRLGILTVYTVECELVFFHWSSYPDSLPSFISVHLSCSLHNIWFLMWSFYSFNFSQISCVCCFLLVSFALSKTRFLVWKWSCGCYSSCNLVFKILCKVLHFLPQLLSFLLSLFMIYVTLFPN